MIAAARPVWAEGMLLCPHHMQQQDLYHEQFVDARLRALASAPWGLLSLVVDLPALRAGTFQLGSVAAILPDGTPIRVDAGSPHRPPSRTIAPHFPARADALTVYLGLQLLREGVANVGPHDGPAPRFRGSLRRVVDLTAARSERELQVAEPALVILFDGEPRDDYTVLPIAELVRDESGGFDLSPGYIPPCLALAAAPALVDALHDLLGRAVARRRRLADERRADADDEPLTRRDLDRALHLHALDRSLGWLRHCGDVGDTHPRTLYRALVDLAGALATTADGVDPTDLPPYAYSDLRASFAPLLAALRRQLSREFDPVCLEIPLRPHQGSSWLGELRDDRTLHCSTFLLVVEPDGDLVVAASEIPAVTKIAGWKRIPAIVRQNTLGVPLRAVLRPPAAVPHDPRAVYFSIDTTDPLWHEIVAERKAAIYLRPPYDPQRARVRLLALPGEEA